MKRLVPSLAAICIVAIASGTAWGAGAELPYAENFEGSNGALGDPWTYSPGTTAQYDNTYAVAGTNGAYISDQASFNIDVGYGPYSNVWWWCYVRVTPQSGDPSSVTMDSDSVAGFYVSSDNKVYAYDFDDWVQVDSGIPTEGWIGFAVHLDYETETYDIYKTPDTYSYGASLNQLNTGITLDFNDTASATEFTRADIEGTTYIDEFAMNVDDVAAGAAGSNAANAAIEIVLGEELTGVLSKYFTVGADRQLDGKLGEALESTLLLDDKVYVYDAANSEWDIFTHNGTTLNPSSAGASLTMEITPTTAIFLDYDDPNADRQPARVTAYNSVQPPSDVTVETGWNALCRPFGSATVTFSEGSIGGANDFPAGTEGDLIRIRRSGGGYSSPIIHDGTIWRRGRGPADGISIGPGQAFWYLRRGAPLGWAASNIGIN
jgi:hypothetical protein